MTSVEFRSNPLFLRNQFDGIGVFDMPLIRKQNHNLDDIKLLGYDKTKSEELSNRDKFVHFFLDDYKFETLWKDPEPRLEKLLQYRGMLTPQYSTYTEMPLPLHIYNTFRSRWVGAWYQNHGVSVIPTVYWGEPQSYWFCFDGIERGAVVAISMIGVKREKDFFLQGYQEMMKRIEPEAIICYGDPFDEMKGNIIPIDYAATNHLMPSKNQDSGTYMKKTTECIDALQQNSNPVKSEAAVEGYVKYTMGYVEKGYGSAGSGGGGGNPGSGSRGNWSPKKKEDERYLGKPGEIKETKGGEYQTKIGEDGRAERERHNTNHGRPYHSDIHDHEILWADDGSPRPGPPINYWDEKPPKFKIYKGEEIMAKYYDLRNPEYNAFTSMDDFRDCMERNGEVEFEWMGKNYAITHPENRINIGEMYNMDDDTWCDSVEELLQYQIGDKKLSEIFMDITVNLRTV